MDARFVAACSTAASLPPPDLPEVAVAGRSNCGKSSLINAITGRTALARTSSTPGRTQQLIFFRLSWPELAPPQGPSVPEFLLVDLPGYGYARASKERQREWGKLVTDYIDSRETLRVLLVLCDLRRTPGPEELDLLRWAAGRDLRPIVVLTKADKLRKSQRFAALESARTALGLQRRPRGFSVHEPDAVTALRRELLAALAGLPLTVSA